MWIDDQVLARCADDLAIELWIPQSPLVVLGRSNKVLREAYADACARDAVPIVKRLGGGGTVLLHSGCLIVSIGTWVKDVYANDRYFRLLNQALIDCIQKHLAERTFEQRGFSDIVFEGRKVAGTSLFRSRNYLLYQASILIETRAAMIAKYLPHPSAEPDYRKARSHGEFLIGLEELGSLSVEEWLQHFQASVEVCVRERLASEFIDVPLTQIEHVKGRQGEQHSLV